MLTFFTELKPAKGKEEELELILLQLAIQVRVSEPGNAMFQLTRDEHGKLFIWNMFVDEKSAQWHLNSLHYKAAMQNASSLLEAPPLVAYHELLNTNIT